MYKYIVCLHVCTDVLYVRTVALYAALYDRLLASSGSWTPAVELKWDTYGYLSSYRG